MGEYQYPLFFEARDLTDREKEKIWRHFQRRRDSGGGECAVIEKVEDNFYKVSFKQKQDQERVLLRKTHIISIPGGELRLTVSQTSSPQTQDQPSTSRFKTCTRPDAKCLEMFFETDLFLLYYLRDNPKVFKILEQQLPAIGCTLELDFDEEGAVVMEDFEKGAARAFYGRAEKWELQVHQIFIGITENYLCHYVLEPKQVIKVLQDRSLVDDDIKVYTEVDYAVVVGETEAVKEKIAILEKSIPTQTEMPVVENKFKLVEDEFKQEISSNYPEVKISRGLNNSIILEGPDEDVQAGAAKLDELMKGIKEKRVQLQTDILFFMSISGFASKFQTHFQQSLRSPVSVEVGSDLVLSSLSPDSLSEAERSVLRDLSVTSVELQGAAAVPPDLTRVKEILIKTKEEANRGEFRVDVSFISPSRRSPTTKVQLVGYTEHVNTLREVLHDFLENQIITHKALNLQLPEMVDHFDKILKMFGIKQTKVTLKASHFPNPCVLLSGPLRLVKETQQVLVSALASLTLDTLVLDGPGALLYFQGDGKVSKELVESSCQVLIWEQQDVYSPTTKPRSISSFTPGPPTPRSFFNMVGQNSVNNINIEIKVCSLEDEQVNVLVAPMVNSYLSSTNIGKCLLHYGGNTLQTNFNSKAAHRPLSPGEVLEVDASSSLGCSKIFFIECTPWDGVTGWSALALGDGLRRCLDLCVQQGFSSVAIPVIGPGVVFNYPLSEAVQVLTENIYQFGLSANCGSLTTIHIVIKPGYPDSEDCYYEVCNRLKVNMNHRALFRSLTTDLDDVNMIVGGGATLQVVFGDITNETTDAVVNTTNFKNLNKEGVCKDILSIAGPEVEAELKAGGKEGPRRPDQPLHFNALTLVFSAFSVAKVNRGGMIETKPGLFPCKALLHVRGAKYAGVVEQLVCSIIDCCERNRFKSVAIPAIRAGAGGMDPSAVAGEILRGIRAATSSTHLYSLTTIRLVLIEMDVFLTFKEEAMKMFSPLTQMSVPQLPQVQHPPASADLSSSASQQSAFQFLGLSIQDVDDAMETLKNLYEAQCSNQTFRKADLEGLANEDMLSLQQLVETEGLYVQMDPFGDLTVSGLKDGVNKMVMCMHDILREKVRTKEEDSLYSLVMWCILGQYGSWERLPKTANYKLEKKDTAGGMHDARGVLWQVDLQNMEATSQSSGQQANMKRLENLEDFTFPLYWDSMAASEVMKMVTLQPFSQEYQTVKMGFKRTAQKNIKKIERLQNIHLRRAYEAQKKQLADKNKHRGGAGEKPLYHGTTLDNSDAIMKTGFNRRFAGQNATAYGEGTYFAVNASYSAHPTYSKPAADGSQRMFVVRVLTGLYTLGQRGLKVPPARNDQSGERFDSVVDDLNDPYMYVVFHDDQAYPDYLITFK